MALSFPVIFFTIGFLVRVELLLDELPMIFLRVDIYPTLNPASAGLCLVSISTFSADILSVNIEIFKLSARI